MKPEEDILSIYEQTHATLPGPMDTTCMAEYPIRGLGSYRRFRQSVPSKILKIPEKYKKEYACITSWSPLHKSIANDIRSHTFILDNVYGKQGIHTVSTTLWIGANHSWTTFTPNTSTIEPGASILEIETHTYQSSRNASLALSISLLVYGTHEASTPRHMVPIHHPWVLGWEYIPLRTYSFSSREMREEYAELIQAMRTV